MSTKSRRRKERLRRSCNFKEKGAKAHSVVVLKTAVWSVRTRRCPACPQPLPHFRTSSLAGAYVSNLPPLLWAWPWMGTLWLKMPFLCL